MAGSVGHDPATVRQTSTQDGHGNDCHSIGIVNGDSILRRKSIAGGSRVNLVKNDDPACAEPVVRLGATAV